MQYSEEFRIGDKLDRRRLQQQGDFFVSSPEKVTLLSSDLSSTEKIQCLSHSHHLLRRLLLGLAHNFGY